MSLKPYPAYKDSGVAWLGDVPEHWLVAPVKFIGRLRGGAGFPHDAQGKTTEELPFYKVNSLGQANPDGTLTDTDNTVSRETANTLGAYIFPIHSIVFAKVGAALLLGRIRTLATEACLDNNMMGLIVGKHCLPKFVEYALSLVRFDLISNPGAVPSLNEAQIGSFRLSVPPITEQTAIAGFLNRETGKIDELITEQEKLIALLTEKRQATISDAVTKGLNPASPMKDSGVEWLGQIPAHWEMTTLHRLFRFVKRHNGDDLEVLSVYRDFGVILKSSRDDNINKTPEDLSKYQTVLPADVVVNKMKSWQGSLGVSNLHGITSPDYAVFEPTHESNSTYLNYLLRCSLLPDVYRSISNGIRPDQWRIEPDKFLGLTFPMPPMSEQVQLAAFLDTELTKLDDLTAEANRVIDVLKERRTAIISAAVTGKIDVRGAVAEQVAA